MTVICPSCGNSRDIADGPLGGFKPLRCRRCGTVFQPTSVVSSFPNEVPVDSLIVIEPEPLRDRKHRDAHSLWKSLLVIVIASLVLVIVGIGSLEFLHRKGAVGAAVKLIEGADTENVALEKPPEDKQTPSAENSEPGILAPILNQTVVPFRLVPVDLPVSLMVRTFEIPFDRSLIVESVTCNSVYEPRLESRPSLGWIIGRPKHSIYSAFTLEHEIIYVDVYTNKGSYRFDPDGRLIGRDIGGPRPDIKQLTGMEDAKIEAKENAIITARKEMQKGDMTSPLLKKYADPFERWALDNDRKVELEVGAKAYKDRLFKNAPPPSGRRP